MTGLPASFRRRCRDFNGRSREIHVSSPDSCPRLALAFLFLVAGLTGLTGCGGEPAASHGAASAELREKSVEALREVLHQAQRWQKVHAAEKLIQLDYQQGVLEVFEKEMLEFGHEPQYRIGIWRVLAAAAQRPEKRAEWIERIWRVFANPGAPDRLHACETLAKLGYRAKDDGQRALIASLVKESTEAPLAAYATWLMALQRANHPPTSLAELLESDEPASRRIAAYGLGSFPELPENIRSMLQDAALNEPHESGGRAWLVSAAYVQARHPETAAKLKASLLEYLREGTSAERYEAAQALAVRGQREDVSVLELLLAGEHADERVGAAYSILRIGRRDRTFLTWLDWLVVVGCVASMLLVGWYYMARTRSADDYLLGGRRMRPWAVGLSLFATLLSTITYLSIPGEIIKNGPMILAQIAAFPLVFLTVGYFAIPFIMRLKVTSAYEILEVRFGASTRMLGSLLFLALRLLWMSVIVYATTDKVLVPLLGLDAWLTPWLCGLLVIITIVYTSMGGLRAVVVTDVAQTFILFGGAVAALVLLSVQLGGPGSWWSGGWAPHWEAPCYGFNFNVERAMPWIIMSLFLWFFCTSASDQMAIQRYLATRDAKAARRVLGMSLAANAVIMLFLAVIGLGLLAYFRKNPHMMFDGQRVLDNPDQLFPRYISFALPPGVSGLVIAGLLAAAMSSLSSGLNSSCSVITVDWINRFSKTSRWHDQASQVRLAKLVSVSVGLVVVLLTFSVAFVPGNLLEVAYRVVNLLTVPLFILFGMAMFVPWATPFGAWAGCLLSAAAANLIAWWSLMFAGPGPSVMFILPAAFVAGMVGGMLASLMPIGPRARASIRALKLA